ncbi:MAG: tRNA-queuosine alpha-mannosyltransferase domain-containing protein [Spirochaetota bacterium]
MPTLEILFIEPFYGGSHKAFADELARYSRHNFTLFTLPARFWKWRMRGAALEVVRRIPSPDRFDLVVAASMLSLADLKALWGAACPPLISYFHENQLNYPLSPGETRDFHYGFTDITTGLAADRIVFNSHYHKSAFFEELPGFISCMPDTKPTWVVEELINKSLVCHPGIAATAIETTHTPAGPPAEPPLILWNHRWEHDKNPEGFFRVLAAAADRGLQFRLALVGEQFSRYPQVFDQARERLGGKIVQFGYVGERAAYYRWLRQADIVVSTAYQENFGLSIAEATAAGCYPLLPRRLSYPELIPPEYHSACLYKDEAELERRLGEILRAGQPAPAGLAEAMRRYSWTTLREQYDGLFGALAH